MTSPTTDRRRPMWWRTSWRWRAESGATVRGLMPQDTAFASVAAWVNFELTENISEIHQLVLRHDNSDDAD